MKKPRRITRERWARECLHRFEAAGHKGFVFQCPRCNRVQGLARPGLFRELAERVRLLMRRCRACAFVPSTLDGVHRLVIVEPDGRKTAAMEWEEGKSKSKNPNSKSQRIGGGGF